jgi:hypothetical protein
MRQQSACSIYSKKQVGREIEKFTAWGWFFVVSVSRRCA